MQQTNTTSVPQLFIGMDIHKKSWKIHLRTDLCEHKSMTMPPNSETLAGYVERHFPRHEVCLTYEAGCCGFGAARYFLGLGWQVLVVNASDVPRSDKQYYQKTDKLDCMNLSRQLRAGQLRGIYIPDQQHDQLKSLLRHRAEVTRQLRSVKQHIKSLLLYQGVEVPGDFDGNTWSHRFIGWLKSLPWAYSTGKVCLESQLRLYEVIHHEHLGVANELRAYCREHFAKDYHLLKSIPGVGGYLASAILAELGDLRRFNNETQLAGYVGLVPVIHSSGMNEQMHRITPRCRALLRSYVIEASWVALRHDPELQAYYRRHQGRNSKTIIVKVARKLLNRMLSVIKNETPYRINYNEKTDEKLKPMNANDH